MRIAWLAGFVQAFVAIGPVRLLPLFSQLPNNIIECLLNIDAIFCGCFDKSHPSSRARALPSCVETSLSATRSHLLPTSITGAGPNDPEPVGNALDGDPGYVDDPGSNDFLTR